MRILMIRHGLPNYQQDALTPQGQMEARLLSCRLAGYDLGDCFSSPLGRARETAQLALRRTGQTPEELPWLAEFRGRYPDPDTGKDHLCWDILPRLWTQYPESFDPDRWAHIPLFQGGNVADIWEETKAGVDSLLGRYGFRKAGPVWLAEENRPQTLTLFCHFGISMAILGYLTDVSPLVYWHHFVTLPTSLTEVLTEERIQGEVSFRTVRLGDMAHLEANGEPISPHALFPECYNGLDSTDPALNGMPLRTKL